VSTTEQLDPDFFDGSIQIPDSVIPFSPPPATMQRSGSVPKSPTRGPAKNLPEVECGELVSRTLTPVPEAEGSPPYDSVVAEFKDALLTFNIDLLLNDIDLIKNIRERGDKVVYRKPQLQALIAILLTGDKNKMDCVDIETETLEDNCICCKVGNIFYQKIKNIHVNKTTNFMSTEYAVRLQQVFKINLEVCII
jgi:hypothetical protein